MVHSSGERTVGRGVYSLKMVSLIFLVSLISCSGELGPTATSDQVAVDLVVQPATATVGVGGTLQLTATPVLASGDPVPGYTISWLSSDVSIATVTNNGLVTAVAPGTTAITGSAEKTGDPSSTVQASATIVVDATPVASVVVNPSSAAVGVGRTFQLQAVTLSANGDTLTGRPVSWSSSDAAIATVNQSGTVTGVSEGTATITATSEGQSGTSVITVSLNPPPPPPDTTQPPGSVAELPRVFLDTSYPTLSGGTIRVGQGDDLQAAIDAAQPGDLILLESGAEFVGTFTLRDKSGSDWIVIQTDAALPPEGTRVLRSDTAWMAKIRAPAGVNAPAIETDARAHNYRLVGLHITSQGGASARTVIVSFQGPTIADMPSDLTIDRSVVLGHRNEELRRCVLFNAKRLAVIDSHVGECHANGYDSQAILSYKSPGPLKIVNNFLEGAGENVMFGGANPGGTGEYLPEDIEVRHNHFFKPLSWAGRWSVKNLFESKFSRRVLVEGNVFENVFKDAQIGFAILLKAPGPNPGAPDWARTEDWTIRYNRFLNVNHGVEVVFQQGTRRVDIHDNVFAVEVGVVANVGNGGRLFETVGNVEDLRIVHNTGFVATQYGQGFILLVASQSDRLTNLVLANNVIDRGNYGIKGSGLSEGSGTLNTTAPGHFVRGNVFNGANCSVYPANNYCPADRNAVGFEAWQSGNYRLSPSSPFKGRATDGSDPGADIDLVDARTANVR